METKELSINLNLNFDSNKFQELISDFVNNDLQFIINDRLKSIINQCVEIE